MVYFILSLLFFSHSYDLLESEKEKNKKKSSPSLPPSPPLPLSMKNSLPFPSTLLHTYTIC